MKTVFTIVILLASLLGFSQNKSGFLNKLILASDKPEPIQLSIDTYPFLFLSSGGGGSISIESSNWQIGIIGFSVVPPDYIKNAFFENADNVKVIRNSAFELFGSYYLRKDRKGIYIGALGGPEWFRMEDHTSGTKATIVKSYFVPRMGVRIFPFKRIFYADASFGWSFNMSGTETITLGQTSYNASRGGFIYFLQLGARFNLMKNK